MWPRLDTTRSRLVALGGLLAALALVPLAPAGVPIIVGGLAAAASADRTGAAAAAGPDGAAADGDGAGRSFARHGVQVSGVDLQEGQRAAALRYSAPGEDGHVVETEPQRTVERQADRRGKKVKRKRR